MCVSVGALQKLLCGVLLELICYTSEKMHLHVPTRSSNDATNWCDWSCNAVLSAQLVDIVHSYDMDKGNNLILLLKKHWITELNKEFMAHTLFKWLHTCVCCDSVEFPETSHCSPCCSSSQGTVGVWFPHRIPLTTAPIDRLCAAFKRTSMSSNGSLKQWKHDCVWCL